MQIHTEDATTPLFDALVVELGISFTCPVDITIPSGVPLESLTKRKRHDLAKDAQRVMDQVIEEK